MNFLTYVVLDEIIDPNKDLAKFNQKIDRILEKYDQNEEAKPEIETCHCKQTYRLKQIQKQTEANLGITYDQLKKEFWGRFGKTIKDFTDDELTLHWKDIFHEYDNEARRVSKELPALNTNPTCFECGGSGYVKVYLNKLAKWNRFDVGGRWNGILHGVILDEMDHHYFNCMPIKDWLRVDMKMFPYAVVSKEFWVSNPDSVDNWGELVIDYFKKFEETGMLVALDCHI